MTTPLTRETAPAFLSPEEAAQVLRCAKSAVLEAIRLGELPKVQGLGARLIRIPREALWPDATVEPLGFEDRRVHQEIRKARELVALADAQLEQARAALDTADAVMANRAAQAVRPSRKAA